MEEVREPSAHSLRRRGLITFGLAAGTVLAPATVAQADVITVDTLADGYDTPGTTLREAIVEANKGSHCEEDPSLYDPDTIRFASGLTGTITLEPATPLPPGQYMDYCAPEGEIPIYDDITIDGPGAEKITISGGGETRIFVPYFPDHRIDFNVEGVTLTEGFAEDNFGGAIWTIGAVDLTIENSVVTGNTVHATGSEEGNYFGGGINAFNFFGGGGPLVIKNSLITDNVAEGPFTSGGGVASFSVPVTIENSTITDNHADSQNSYGGGGLDLMGGNFEAKISGTTISGNTTSDDGGGLTAYGIDVTLTNSTIFGNQAGKTAGGALFQRDTYYPSDQYGTATLRNVTVAGNTAGGNGGGVRRAPNGNTQEKPTITNSIVADNTAGGAQANMVGNFNGAFSLIETAPATFADTVTGSSIVGQDPQLGPLAGNGGPTQTVKPAATSPVVDKGKASGGPALDQRGQARPFDVASIFNSSAPGADGADMGAVELNASETPGGGPGNTVPTADFTFSPLNPVAGQTIEFHSTSSDPDGSIATVQWDLDDDGFFDDGSTADVNKAFAAAGSYDVSVRVVDNLGAPAQITKTVVVTEPNGNVPPFADFTFAPSGPQAGQVVTFSSTSTDIDGTIAAALWDLDGDGEFDDGNGASASTSFADPGSYTVSLRVTDSGSAADDSTKTVVVSPPGGGGGGGPVPSARLDEGKALSLVKKLRKCNKKKGKKSKKKCRRKALKNLRAAGRTIEPGGAVVRGLPIPADTAMRMMRRGS